VSGEFESGRGRVERLFCREVADDLSDSAKGSFDHNSFEFFSSGLRKATTEKRKTNQVTTQVAQLPPYGLLRRVAKTKFGH
jgi:hypothetical protein